MTALGLSRTRIGPLDTRAHHTKPMIPTIREIKKEALVAIAGVALTWTTAVALAADITRPQVDIHSDQATVPVWVFGTTLVSAIIFTIGATWKIARGFTKLEHKIETLEREKASRS